MWIFIDESGSFSWTNKGKSLFCGLNLSNKELPELEKRFAAWKRTVVGQSKAELKGQHLTANQLYSFACKVLPPARRQIHLTLVGGDTQVTKQSFVERLRDQAAELFQLSSGLCAEHGNSRVRETYRQMSGWVRNRSTSNVFWAITLQQAIVDTLQHAIVCFAELEHSSEFDNIEIAIDKSFIRRDEHVEFWREWLRNDLIKGSRSRGMTTIKEWLPDHPFRNKYLVHKGLFDFNDLFRNHTEFRDSKSMIGLQIADICAHIFYRYFRNVPDTRAFEALRPRVVGENGIVLHTITVTEASLHHDDLANHVGAFDIDEWKRLADERSRINTPALEALPSTDDPPQ